MFLTYGTIAFWSYYNLPLSLLNDILGNEDFQRKVHFGYLKLKEVINWFSQYREHPIEKENSEFILDSLSDWMDDLLTPPDLDIIEGWMSYFEKATLPMILDALYQYKNEHVKNYNKDQDIREQSNYLYEYLGDIEK